MAKQITDEELEEINKEIKANTTPKMNEVSYRKMLENLGKQEGYDYISDFDKLKGSLLDQSYSPYTNKIYSKAEKENLTERDYYEDLMSIADHTDQGTSWSEVGKSALATAVSSAIPGANLVATPILAGNTLNKALDTNEGKTFLWGVNEGTGGTAIYKAVKGEEAVKEKLNQIERVYGNNQAARLLGNIGGKAASITLGGTLGGTLGAGVASGLSSAGQAATYSNNPTDIATSGITSGLSTVAFMGIADKLKSAFPIFSNPVGNVAKNAGIGAVAGYSTSTLGKLGTNVGKVIKGEEVTGEDWAKSFYGMDTALSTGISALTYGILGTVADSKQAQLNLQVAKKDYQELLNALDRGDQTMYNAYANGDVEAAKEAFNQGNALIDLMGKTKYDGVVIDPSKSISPLRDMWSQKATMYENMFRGKLPDGSAVTTPSTVDTSLANIYNQPVGGGVNGLGSYGGDIYKSIQQQGKILGENGGENRLPNGIQESLEKGNKIYGAKREEVVSQVLQDDRKGYYEMAGNPELNKDLEKSNQERIVKATDELKNEPVINIVNQKFTKDFIEKGYTDMNGKVIKSYSDLADQAQVFRNPMYETFRFMYMNDDVVVGLEAVSSQLADRTEMFASSDERGYQEFLDNGFEHVRQKMKELGANGYYLFHNHPSGNAFVGEGDFAKTKELADNVAGFKGHLVVNSGTYALMTPKNNGGYRVRNGIKIRGYKPDEIDKMMSTDPWFNTKITTESLANVAYSVKNDPNYSIVVLTDASDKPRITMDVSNSFFDSNTKNINTWLKNVGSKTGGTYAYLTTNNPDVFNKISSKKGGSLYGFNDVVLYGVNEDGNLLAKSGRVPDSAPLRIIDNLGSATDFHNSTKVYDKKADKAIQNQLKEFEKENKQLGKQLKTDNTSYTNAIKSKGEKIEKLQGDVAKANEKVAKANTQLKNVQANNKEVVKDLKSQNKRDVANAVKEVKTENKEALKKQKEKDAAILKESKLDAKANTTKKKFGRATTKLEKDLTNVYGKPESKELNDALEKVKKSTRGAMKLMNKVRTQIPSSMSVVIDDINDMLDTYYTGGNQMTEAKRTSLEKKAAAIEKFAKENPTIPISKQALDIIKQSTQKTLSNLKPADLVELAENIQTAALDIRDSMSFVRADEDAIKLRQEAIDFVKKELAKGGRRTTTPTNKVANIAVEGMRGYTDFNSNVTRIITNLSNGDPNSPFYFIDDRLREGTTDYFKFQEQLLKPWEKFVTVHRAKGLGKYTTNELDYALNPKNRIKMSVKTTTGEDFRMSIGDAISTVLGRKDLQFAGHTTGVLSGKFDKDGNPIVTEGGYAIYTNPADEINGNIEKGFSRGKRVKLTNKIVDQIEEELNNIPAAKAIMDTYSNSGFLKDNANIINDAHEAITGMSIDERENYFRVVTNPNERKASSMQSQNPTEGYDVSAKTALLNKSMVKPVVEGADGSIRIYPIGDVISRMIDDTSIYGAFATQLYDIDTFLKAVDEDGLTLRDMIGNLDPDFLRELDTFMDAVTYRTHNNVGAKIIANTKALVGNYTGSILHGNAFLALKQVGSLPTAAPFFKTPAQSILNGIFNKKGIEKMVRDYYTELGEDVSGLNDKEVFDKFFKEATTELETRKRGYTKPTKKEIFKHTGALKKLEVLDWYKSVDMATVNTLAYSMVYDFLTNFNQDMSHEELIKELGSQFIKMHYSTQPNSAPYTRTLGQLSDNPLARAVIYMADPRLKQLNTDVVIRQQYKWSKENGTPEENKEYGGKFASAFIGALASLAYITGINAIKKGLRKKDEKPTGKDFVMDMIANATSIYAIGFDMIINRIISEDYDFDVSIPDIDVINKMSEMYNHSKNLVKHRANGEDNYLYKDVKNVISDISYLFGVPVKNVQDDFKVFLSAIDSDLYYEMEVKEDANMYKKYMKFEDRIGSYKDFYTLYKATRQKVVEEKYGKYNNANIKKAIEEAGGDTGTYFKVFRIN